MNEEFICVDRYDEEIFQKILLLRIFPHWNAIDYFMCYKYREKWTAFKKVNNIRPILPVKEELLDKYLLYMRKEDDKIDFFKT